MVTWLLMLACSEPELFSGPLSGPVSSTSGTLPLAPGLDERPVALGCSFPERPTTGFEVRMEQVFVDLPAFTSQTTSLARRPDDPGWWYLLEQDGRVVRFRDEPTVDAVQTVLDLSDRVVSEGELGLLALAFAPDFATSGHAFALYNSRLPGGDYVVRLARFTSLDGGATLDRSTELTLLAMVKEKKMHHGGQVGFGPDGYLYFALGDGGPKGDPEGHAQDPTVLWGKMLRLDVSAGRPGAPYAIPPDNPYAQGGGRPEIWASGFRNPWRWSFDPVTGDLWLGDVGDESWEEIDRIVRGGNYGWNIVEGPACFSPAEGCDRTGLVEPVVSVPTGSADAVVAGLVYRGTAVPELVGSLVFDDYVGDDLYRVVTDPGTGESRAERIASGLDDIVSWTYGPGGESFGLSLHGRVWRIAPAPPQGRPFPATLSATGCVDPQRPDRPAAGLIPFVPSHGFWSDGFEKDRWVAVPEDGLLHADPVSGDIEAPIGTVLVKLIRDGATPVETRLLARHEDGSWGGYTYHWRPDGSDADLVPAGEIVSLPELGWEIPSRSQCMECHTSAAGASLGLELRQLDSAIRYDATGRVANQLDTLAAVGLFDGPIAHPGPFPSRAGGTSADEARARAWLHVNCSMCHRAGGGSPVAMDLRFDVPLAETGLCEAPEVDDLGLPGARLVAPGDPGSSVLSARIRTRGANQMPPLGTFRVDETGADAIDAWITGLRSCP